jgi:hypothetical protein
VKSRSYAKSKGEAFHFALSFSNFPLETVHIVKDYQHILQVGAGAGKEEIQAAFRRLAKQYHPDVNKAPDAQQVFCEIHEAYAYLLHHAGKTPESGVETAVDDEVETILREARERAKAHARMRYEKFKKQHEAFQVSGINDLALIFTLLGRMFGLVLFLFLALLPVTLAWLYGWALLATAFLSWPFAGILGWYIRDNRKTYFRPGRLYYTPGRILKLLTNVRPTEEDCFYCKAHKADSVPARVELYLLKDLKLSTGGFRQHQVNYVNKNVVVVIPRCRKALRVHSLLTVLRVLLLLAFMIFLPVTSLVWRYILGTAAGMVLSWFVLVLSSVRANNSYLFTPGFVFRLLAWTAAISLASRFNTHPFDITTTDSIQFVLAAILIFDCLLMQLTDLVGGKITSRPLFRQHPQVTAHMAENYHAYNDIPFVSVIYPTFRWFFG